MDCDYRPSPVQSSPENAMYVMLIKAQQDGVIFDLNKYEGSTMKFCRKILMLNYSGKIINRGYETDNLPTLKKLLKI